jgi:hypothetical protein
MTYEGLRKPRKQRSERQSERAKLWRDYISGKTYVELAAKYGVSTNTIGKRIAKLKEDAALAELGQSDIRQIVVHGTFDVLSEMADIMHAPPAPAYSNGRPIIDPETGVAAKDYSAIIAAADRVMKAHERLARITGVEAPEQTAIGVSLQAQQIASSLAQEAMARLSAASQLPTPALTQTTAEQSPITIITTVDELQEFASSNSDPDATDG